MLTGILQNRAEIGNVNSGDKLAAGILLPLHQRPLEGIWECNEGGLRNTV